MTAIVSGNNLGLTLTSFSTLGQRGAIGSATSGRNGEQGFVNIANGNLILQNRDDRLVGRGLELASIRTYNSQGVLDGDNNDNWKLGFYKQVTALTGTVNTAGSTVTRVDGDGAESVFTYDPAQGLYLNHDGGGAYDTLSNAAGTQTWTFTDGSTRIGEVYDASGRLTQIHDPDGNGVSFTYNAAGLITQVSDASGETTYLDYTGANLTDLRTVTADGQTSIRTRYSYDAANRLTQVITDLSPGDASIADGNTYTVNYTYEGTSNRIASVVQSDGTRVAFTYVQAGSDWKVSTVTDALGGVTRFDYTVNTAAAAATANQNVLLSTEVQSVTRNVNTAQLQTTDTVTGTLSPGLLTTTDTVTGTLNPGLLQTGIDGVYYTVTAGDTWASIATALYGAPDVATQLQSALGSPALNAGARLTGLPASLNATITVAPYYTVTAGDTWASIATALYGTAAIATQLQSALGNPVLTAGARLTGLPATLSAAITAAPYYTVTAGDTWATIATALYGNADVALELQAAQGNPSLAGGARLTGLPAALTHTSVVAVTPYYIVQPGDTWASVAQTVYGTRDANAVSALQAALGNPALNAGVHLAMPASLAYNLVTGGSVNVTDPLGGVSTLAFDATGELTDLLTPTVGGVRLETQYGYDANGNVTNVTDALGNVVTYGYDANGNRVLERDALGNTVTRLYDAKSELLSETTYLVPDPDGAGVAQAGAPQSTRYAYDANGHLRFVVSAQGRVTEYRYDGFGQQVAAIEYSGALYDVSALAPSSTLTEASLVTWLAGVDKSKSMRVDTSYDFRGQVASKTSYAAVDALGNGVTDGTQAVTQYVYDAAGNRLMTVDARGVATSTVANDFVTTYAYDGLGRLLSTTDALGNTTVTAYDDAHGRTVMTLANGLVSTSTYDAKGELLSVVQSVNGQTLGATRYFYDVAGRLARTVDATGVSSYVLYDEAGRQTGAIDGTGSLTEYRYDADGNLVKSIQYATAVSAAALASLTDASGNPTTVTLASLRPAASSQDRATWNAYDAAGRLVKSVDAAGFVTQRFYDGAGEVTDVVQFANAISAATLTDTPQPGDINPASSAADRLTRNLYDADGKLRATLDAEGYLVEHKYDGAGELVETVGYANATAANLRASGTLAQLTPAASASDIHGYTLYNARGQVAGTVDGEGYLTESVYDTVGNTTQVMRYGTRVTYTAGATLAALRPASNPQDQVTASTYTALNQVASETNFEGTLTRYTYDPVGNLTQTVRAVNTADVRTVTAQYDRQGRLTAQLSGNASALLTGNQTQAQIDAIWAANAIHYSYDAAGRRTSSTDANGNRNLFYYDTDGRLAATINAMGEVQESRYNALGQLTQTIAYGTRLSSTTLAGLSGGLIDATVASSIASIANAQLDSITRYSYTVRGQVASVTDPLSLITSESYDAFGNLITRSQQIGAGQTLDHAYAYDRRGLLTQTLWDPAGINASASSVYDAFGRAVQTTDANGNVRATSFDKLGRAIVTVDPTNASRSTTYDAFGRVLTQRDSLNNTTSFTYSNANRSVTMTTPEGVVVTTVHTRLGQTQTVTDGRGGSTQSVYDADGNLKQVTDALGQVTTRSYDKAGRLTEMVDARGTHVLYSYDAANRVLTRQVDPAGLNLTTTYAYDAKGQTVSVTDARGIATQTQFDLKGEVTRVIVDPAGLKLTTTYAYDGRGKVITVTAGEGSVQPRVTQYAYDKLGRRTEEHVDPAGVNATTRYTFDKNNNVLTKTDALGNLTRYVYDADDRLVYTVDPLGGVTENDYDAEGRIVATTAYATPINFAGLTLTPTLTQVQTLINAIANPAKDALERSVFDRDGRRVYSVNGVGAVTQFTYDANGNVVDRIGYANAIPTSTPATAAAVSAAVVADATHDNRMRTVYDALNRALFTIDGTGAVTKFNYDANGNVIDRTGYVTPVATTTVVTAAALTAVVVADAARDTHVRNVFDAANRMVFSIDGVGAVTQNLYDTDGNVIETIAYANAIPTTTAAIVAAIQAALVPDPAHDNHTCWTYDAGNRMVFSVDALGAVTQSFYDANGKVTQRIAYANTVNVTLPATAAAVQAALIPDAARDAAIRAVFDAAGRKVFSIDALGAVTQNFFDANGNVIRSVAYAAALSSAQLAILGSSPGSAAVQLLIVGIASNAQDRVAQRVLDADNRLVYSIDALGFVAKNDYDALGHMTRTTRFAQAIPAATPATLAGVQTALAASAARLDTFTYDAAGHTLEETQAFGTLEAATTRYVLDAFGNRTSIIDPRGVELSESDSAWAIATRKALGFVDAAGNAKGAAALTVAEKAALRGRYSATQVFDAAGRKTRSIDALGGVTTTVYDAVGNAIQITDPRGNTGYFYFDARGKAVLHVDPEGYVTQTVYDGFGNVVKSVHYANRVVGAVSAAQPPVIVTVAPATGAYVLIDAVRDEATATQYDARNEQTAVTDAQGFTEQLSFDAFGNKLTDRNKLGAVSAFTYDRAGHVLSETLPITSVNALGQSVPVTNRYEYDARGNRVREIEAAGLPEQRVTLYEYDKLNRQTRTIGEAVHVSDATTGALTGTASPIEQKSFDARGNVIETIAANGARTLYYYDTRDRKVAQIDPLGALTLWQYNTGDAPIAELKYGDALVLPAVAGGVLPVPLNAANVRVKFFVYDANNALLKITTPAVLLGEQALGASAFSSFVQDVVTQSVYDADGNVVQVIDARGESTYRYYDRLGQKVLEVDSANYATRWEYDANGNVIRQTQYANKLSLAPSITSSVAALIGNAGTSSTDRVTEFDYDRMNRVVEKRELNVNFGTVAAGGGLTGATGIARTQIQYNGLGQIIRQVDATGAVTDITYDLAGRKLREEDPQFTEFQGTTVRPTVDLEYDGLNQVRRVLTRGKDATTEADDHITTFQYDYGFGARLIGQTDPTLSTTNFFYDVVGNIVQKALNRTNADGVATVDRTSYTYDALKREIARQDLATNQTNETRYDLFGEITGKRTNGGGLDAPWQETTDYDALGRIWKSNSGDGVYKVYLYDANGNETLLIQSAGPDFSTLTLDQVMALAGAQKFLTVSQYDARNKLVGTFQPQMNTSQNLVAIEQFITQSTGTVFSGGAVSVGPVSAGLIKPATDPVAAGSATAMKVGTTSAMLSLSIFNITKRVAFGGRTVLQHSTTTAPGSFSLTLPDTSALGSGDIRVAFSLSVPLRPDFSSTFFVPNGQPTANLALQPAQVASTVLVSRNYAYSVYKETASGEILLGSYSGTTPATGAYLASAAPSRTELDATSSTAIGADEIEFQGQPTGANRLILQYRALNSSSGWSTVSVPQKTNAAGVAISGWFAFDWTNWTRGTYEIKYAALDAGGNVLNSEAGTMVLSDAAPSITQNLVPEKIGGAGRAYLDTSGVLNILEQAASAQSLAVRYRHTGSSEAWTTVGLAPAVIGGASTPGWFVFNPAASGMTGSYDYWIEAKNASGAQVNKALGSFTVGSPNSVSALTAFQDLPEMVHFLSQPATAASMKLSYRPNGSMDAFTTIFIPKVGIGAFDWDATSLVTDRLSNYGYEYQYQTFDAGNALVNQAHGVLQLGTNPAMLSHINDKLPTLITFTPPQTNALKLVLQFRNAGSLGAYTSVALTRANGATPFTWDASSVVPPGTSASLEYIYDLYDGANTAVINPDGTAAHVVGVLNIGATGASTQLKWVIVGTSNAAWTIHRQQTYDAFGDVAQEIDGLGHVKDFSYNNLGLLTEKRDPETNVTLGNGFITRARPTTDYSYDLAGRLVATQDANGNSNTQALLAGTEWGNTPRVLTEFHADGGVKRTAYDVFGDARTLTDEVGRVTLQEFDKVDRLIRRTSAAGAIDTYAYDQSDNRILHTNAQNATERTYYDSLGRVTRNVSYAGAATAYNYTYDNAIAGAGGKRVGGWTTSTTEPTALHSMQDKKDQFGHLTSHTDFGGHAFTYNYNSAGWLTSQMGTTGQNIAYDYYANGYLKSITDAGTGSFTKYEYDAEGNRTLEAYLRNPGAAVPDYLENNTVSYDELNRVVRVHDPKSDIRYEYDANGNRRRVWSLFNDGVGGSQQLQDYWYTYDAMNRFTVTMGKLSSVGGAPGVSATDATVSVVTGTTGVQIGYDAASQRRFAIYGLDNHREDYTYTADGYLEDTNIAGVLRARRFNDNLGRVVKYQEYAALNSPSFGRVSAYDADNKVLSQQEYNGAIGGTLARTITYDYQDTALTNNNVGPLASTTTVDGATTVNTFYTYDWWDTAKEKAITAQPFNANAPGWAPGYSNFSYDVNGHLVEVDDPKGGLSIRYTNDAQGQILVRDEIAGGTANPQGVVTGGTINKHHAFYYLDGHRIGDVGNDANDASKVSYAEALAAGGSAARPDAHKNWKPISSADFDQNYEPINASFPAAAPTLYTVRAGDTLQSIATAFWGDANLWYLIADANGLTAGSTLTAGQTLTIPNKVTNIHNTFQTFKVYNPGQAIGDTSPTLPDPPPPPPVYVGDGGGGCGGLGSILVAVVAIVVTIYTAGVAAPMLGAEVGTMTTMEAGMAALEGSLGAAGVAGAVVGGAVGSIAGQGVGIATGMQDSFSWSQVGLSAIGAGVTAGLGSTTLGQTLAESLGGFGGAVVQGAIRSTVTQGIAVATGLQSKFDWRGVAASAVASGVGYGVGKAIGGFTNNIDIIRAGSGFAAGVASAAMRGGINRDNLAYITADSIGTAVGYGMANSFGQSTNNSGVGEQPQKLSQFEEAAKTYSDGDVGRSELQFGSYQPPSARANAMLDQMLGMMGDPGSPRETQNDDSIVLAAGPGIRSDAPYNFRGGPTASLFTEIEKHNADQMRAAIARGETDLSPTVENAARLGLITPETNPIFAAAANGSFESNAGGAAFGNPNLVGVYRPADPNGFANRKLLDLTRLEDEGRLALQRGDDIGFQRAAIDYALRSALQVDSAAGAGLVLVGAPLGSLAVGGLVRLAPSLLPGYATADATFGSLIGRSAGVLEGLAGSTAVGGGADAGLPPLRQSYVNEVAALEDIGLNARAAGATDEQVGRMLHQMRRDLGEQYKNLTPPDRLQEIYARNLERYGDKLGPSVDWLRARGRSWEQIIQSAIRPGGKDLGF